MTALEELPKREQVDTALLTYWLEGNSSVRASEATGVPETTIRRWVDQNQERLHELRAQNQAEFDKHIAAKAEGIQLQAFQVVAKLIEKVDTDLEAGKIRNPDQAAQRMATVLGIVTDKWLLIQGRPTSIVDNGDAAQKMRSLQARFPWLVVDSTVAEDAPSEPAPQR